MAWQKILVEAGNLSPDTLSSRKRGLQQACECRTPNRKARMGGVKVSMPLAAFVHIRGSFGVRTGAAATCLKALRAAYRWGVEHGFPGNNAVFQVSNTHVAKGGATPWTKGDKEKFLQRHGPGTMARRWFYLADNTAGRIGDTHLLGPKHEVLTEDQKFISWQHGKRGSQTVEVPMSADLAGELAGLPEDSSTYLLTEHGSSFASPGSLDNRIRKWVIEAGLYTTAKNKKGKVVMKATHSQHGTRKARAKEIVEQGGSVYEVMSLLSHSDQKTAAVYTKDFDRGELAKRAMDRRKKG